MTANWLAGKCLALDTETSGTSVFDDRIVTACAAIISPDGTVEFQRDWLIAVEKEIHPKATEKNGLTTEYAQANGIPTAQGIKEIVNAIRYAVHSKMPIVAFNASFDLSILNFECVRNGLGALAEFCGADIFPVIDPMTTDKAVDKFRPGKRTLEAACAHYGVTLENAHTAAADAVAAFEVARALGRRASLPDGELRNLYADRRYPSDLVRAFRNLGRMSLPELHAAQVGWYREQSEGLAAHWRKKAEQLRHEIHNAEDDEARAIAEQELAELEARIDGVRTEWPLVPHISQGALL
jgi:DNA polymerase-3 subunit epsilon